MTFALSTQTYNGGSFIELVQPVSGQSMFHDYLAKYPAGGTQHLAFRLPVSNFDRVIGTLRGWHSSIPIKPWALPPRLWGSPRKDGPPLNKCRRADEDTPAENRMLAIL